MKEIQYKIYILIAACIIFNFTPAKGENIEMMLDSAGSAYTSGNYTKAIEQYEECIKQFGTSPQLLANLGNAYAKAGDYGRAFLNYERALYLNPSDKEVRNNRAYIVSKIEDANKANAGGKKISVVPDKPGFFTQLATYLKHSQKSNTWAVWGVISFVLLCGCVSVYYFRDEVLIRKIGFFGGIGMLVLCIIFNVLSFVTAKASSINNEGIIIEFKTSLKSEPYESSKTVGIPLVRGTKMTILETQQEEGQNVKWYKVRLNSDIAGWIKSKDFEII